MWKYSLNSWWLEYPHRKTVQLLLCPIFTKTICFREIILISSSRDFCINTETILAQRQFFIIYCNWHDVMQQSDNIMCLFVVFVCFVTVCKLLQMRSHVWNLLFFPRYEWHIHVLIVQPEGEILYILCVFWFILSTTQALLFIHHICINLIHIHF